MEVQQLTALASAVAATIAAVLAGLNLRQTGRREHLSWVRAALEGAFLEFLTAAYSHRDACTQICELRQGRTSHRTEDEWLGQVDDAEQAMMKCVGRFRVLVSNDMAELAMRFHQNSAKDIALLNSGQYDSFDDTQKQRADAFRRDRDVFINRARRVLDIRNVHS